MEETKKAEEKRSTVVPLEELDVDGMGACFERKGVIVLHMKGEPRSVVVTAAGWEKTRAEWMKANPRPLPPFTEDLVSPKTDLGRQLKLDKPTFRRVYNDRDPDFLSKLETWTDSLNFTLTGGGVALRLHRKGEDIAGAEAKGKVLRDLGVLPIEAAAAVGLIVQMSRLQTSEAVDFFDASSDTRPNSDGDDSSLSPGSGSKEHDSQE